MICDIFCKFDWFCWVEVEFSVHLSLLCCDCCTLHLFVAASLPAAWSCFPSRSQKHRQLYEGKLYVNRTKTPKKHKRKPTTHPQFSCNSCFMLVIHGTLSLDNSFHIGSRNEMPRSISRHPNVAMRCFSVKRTCCGMRIDTGKVRVLRCRKVLLRLLDCRHVEIWQLSGISICSHPSAGHLHDVQGEPQGETRLACLCRMRFGIREDRETCGWCFWHFAEIKVTRLWGSQSPDCSALGPLWCAALHYLRSRPTNS